jgi:hypothetical protein
MMAPFSLWPRSAPHSSGAALLVKKVPKAMTYLSQATGPTAGCEKPAPRADASRWRKAAAGGFQILQAIQLGLTRPQSVCDTARPRSPRQLQLAQPE